MQKIFINFKKHAIRDPQIRIWISLHYLSSCRVENFLAKNDRINQKY